MESRTDIKLIDNDLVILNDDLILVESDDQHIVDTINAAPGWWKENPTDGVGIVKYQKGKNNQELARSIQINLKSDRYDSRPLITFDINKKLIIETNVKV
jgi:hypothetical protein